jgi:hypothetical protein
MKLDRYSLVYPIINLIILLGILYLSYFNNDYIFYRIHGLYILLGIFFSISQLFSFYIIEYHIINKISVDGKECVATLYDNYVTFYFSKTNLIYSYRLRRLIKIKHIEIIEYYNFKKDFVKFYVNPYKYVWEVSDK